MQYNQYNLDDLFLLAKKGDGTAFEHIVLTTERMIYNLALSMTKCHEDAEDITQDTYLRLWRSLPDYRSDTSARYYILKIARNLTIDLLRKRSKITDADNIIISGDEEFELELPDRDPYSRPDEAYLRKMTAEEIRKCIEELPLPARELIILRDVDGMPYAEISKLLNIPEGTVKSKLFRARERLRMIIVSKNIL